MRTTLARAPQPAAQASAARQAWAPSTLTPAAPASAALPPLDAALDRARRFGHRWKPSPAEPAVSPRPSPAPPDASAPVQRMPPKKSRKLTKKAIPQKEESSESESESSSKSESESSSQSESESERSASDSDSDSESQPKKKLKPKSKPKVESESESEPESPASDSESGSGSDENDPLSVSTNLFGQMTGKASVKGAQFRPPRSYKRSREEQVSKHFTTLLRTAGEHYAKKNKNAADPVEVQSSYLGGNFFLSTNSTTASKNLVDLAGDDPQKLLETTKEPIKAVRRKTHARIQSKVKKTFAGEREIEGDDPEDVDRAKGITKLMQESPGFTFLDPGHKDFDKTLKKVKKTTGGVYIVPGEKHAELNVAEFRDEHLADVDDDRARTYGSKRNCATCHGEMHAQHPGMASGQGPGLLVKNQIGAISKAGKKATYEQMRDEPTNVTLLQHGAMDTGTASDSDTDDEGNVMKKIPSREPKLPKKTTGKKRKDPPK